MRVDYVRFAAAASLAAAMSFGAASARAANLIAEIPFKFRVQERMYPPGEYSVAQVTNNGIPILALRNRDSSQTALLTPHYSLQQSDDKRPRLIFHCGEGGCALAEIWGATASPGIAVRPPRQVDYAERAAFVYLKPQKHP